MKTPYCIIDGIKYQLHYDGNDVLRFPDDGRAMPDINRMTVQYIKGERKLSDLFNYSVNSGSSYELVYGLYSKGGMNNHIVTQGSEPTKHFRIYKGKKP